MNLSVIIPIYNGEKYVEELLDHIKEIFDISDQIIIIDDCSYDSTVKVIKDKIVSLKLQNIELYENNENYGVSYSRNLGILKAKRDFLFFLDSDDSVSKNFKEILSQFLIRYPKAEVIRFNHNQKEYNIPETSFENNDFDSIDKKIVKSYYLHSSCTQIFKRKLVEKIRFDNNIIFGEDLLFTYLLLNEAENIVLLPDILYFYNNRENSASTSTDNKNILKRINSIIIVYNTILATEKKFSDVYISKKNRELSQQLLKIYLNDKEEYEDVKKNIQKEYSKVSLKYGMDFFNIHAYFIRNNFITNILNCIYKKSKKGYFTKKNNCI